MRYEAVVRTEAYLPAMQMFSTVCYIEPPGVMPIFAVYRSIVMLLVLIAAVGRLICASGGNRGG